MPAEFLPANQAYSGGAAVQIFDHYIPIPVTNIYTPGGVGKKYYQGSLIDLSKGSAKFEFNYFGLRYSPYLQLTFNATVVGGGMSVDKTLCFADQVGSNIPKAIDNLSTN